MEKEERLALARKRKELAEQKAFGENPEDSAVASIHPDHLKALDDEIKMLEEL